jgi:hypothetical protein
LFVFVNNNVQVERLLDENDELRQKAGQGALYSCCCCWLFVVVIPSHVLQQAVAGIVRRCWRRTSSYTRSWRYTLFSYVFCVLCCFNTTFHEQLARGEAAKYKQKLDLLRVEYKKLSKQKQGQ